MTSTFNAYELASMADCASPDSEDSYGGKFLLGVQRDTAEHVANGGDADDLHEIADAAPHTYTYQKWQEFVDLAAWNEDLDELGGLSSCESMEKAAGLSLYLIAHRLAAALIEEWDDDDEEEDDDDD